MMIDDLEEVILLMVQLRAELPFRVRVAKGLVKQMRQEKIPVPVRPLVTDVAYMGDEAGITCRLEDPDKKAAGTFISITQVTLPRKLECYREATRYQKRRLKRLRRSSQHVVGINTWRAP